jgi:FKBP-type peptidyl-prolyl cis-trans isomerase FklB
MDMPDIGRPQFEGNPSLADRNQLEGELYIERMNLQPCVYALPSGLHFRILRAMTDETLPSPEASEMVIANYEIRPAEGEIMQSSFATGEPLRGSVGRFIPAWNEALTLMRPGEEWELFVPSALGYGARGIPGSPIGPNQALYFRMELICLPGRDDGGCEA